MLKGYVITILLLMCEVLNAQDFSVSMIPDNIFQRMQGNSWPKDPTSIKRSDYRYLKIKHFTESGKVLTGELICNKSVANDLLSIFRELYEAHYPIHSIRLIDDFNADDEKSMSQNNTSCFNYRTINGKRKLSKHSRGIAIDINPLWNPCIHSDGKIEPANASRTHVITTKDKCYQIFTKHGWRWGGSWRTKKDYQHFER